MLDPKGKPSQASAEDASTRVLLVDDDELVLESVADILRGAREVVTTTSPNEALSILGCGGFQILVTDLQMTEMHGLDLIRSARQIDPDLVAIAITGYGSTPAAIEALRAGAFDFVEKPIRPEILRHAIARAVESIRKQQANNELHREVARVELAKAVALEEAFAELSAAHDELQRTHKRLIHAEKLASVGQLASGVAHEINNPAAFIHANLVATRNHVAAIEQWVRAARTDGVERADELAVEQPLDTVLADLDEIVVDNLEGIERVVRIVNDLLGFARSEPEKVELVDLNSVIESALKLVGKQIRHSAHLVTDLDELPPVEGDSGRLVQVVTNVLINATQATASSEGAKITVATKRLAGSVALTVEDTGCGISEADLDRIFDAFYTTKPRGVGTGLGLSLSASIVRLHGGSIQVESRERVGTRVTVTLPEAGSNDDLDNVTPIRVRRRSTKPTMKPRILIIDDETALLRSMKRLLSNRYTVTTASGGLEALEILSEDSDFDVIFCDLMMPEVDGPMLYHRVTAQDPTLVERFVFCTGGAFTVHAREFLDDLPCKCAQKPLRLQELYALVDSVLERGQARDVG